MAALLALTLAAFTYVVTENLPVGLLPELADGLGVSRSAVGLLITGHAFVVAATAVPLTRAVQRVPRRPLVLALLTGFVASSALAASASGYGVLLVARTLTALTHAAFWSVVAPVASAMFPPALRARVTAGLFAGISLAPLVGIPAVTWLGAHRGWSAGFWAVTGLGLICLVCLTLTLPADAADRSRDAVGDTPDRRAYWSLIAVTALAVTGTFTAYTYVAPLITDLAGFGSGTVSGFLLLLGVAGTIGTVFAGRLAERRPGLAVPLGPLLVGGALLVVAVLGGVPAVVVPALVAWGVGMAVVPSVLMIRVLAVAPMDTALASSFQVAAFNLGIGGGALVGALTLDLGGIRPVVATGAVLALLAVVPAVLARRPQPALN